MRRDQAAVRPDGRHPPERRRGIRHPARQIRAPAGKGCSGIGTPERSCAPSDPGSLSGMAAITVPKMSDVFDTSRFALPSGALINAFEANEDAGSRSQLLERVRKYIEKGRATQKEWASACEGLAREAGQGRDRLCGAEPRAHREISEDPSRPCRMSRIGCR